MVSRGNLNSTTGQAFLCYVSVTRQFRKNKTVQTCLETVRIAGERMQSAAAVALSTVMLFSRKE